MEQGSTLQKIIDISPPLSPKTAVWPGDVPLSQNIQAKLKDGSSVNLSSLESTVHIGAHADAPLHYDDQGLDAAHLELDPYLGLCTVIHCKSQPFVTAENCEAALKDGAKRLLFRTDTALDSDVFPSDFAYITADALELCGQYGVKLVGIDTPSVDPFSSKELPAHHQLLKWNIRNLEGLKLSEVPEGKFELIALPLKLVGFDASPVRAVLRPV